MTNLVQDVWKIIDQDPCVQRNMRRGLINTRALAKYLLKEKKIDASLDAVISAIRRYELDRYEDVFGKANKMLVHTTSLSTKSNLVNIAVFKDPEIQELIPKFFSIIKYQRGDVLRIIQADESIRILIDEKNLEKILEILPKNKIIGIDKNLAEINLHLKEESKSTPGIIALLNNEIAINGVNILEVLTCFPEMLWFVKEKDLLKAYNALYQLCNANKK